MSEIGISVVIPCYSSADWLSKLVGEIRTVLAKNNRSYEIILVNDCSPDNGKTSSEISSICSDHPEVRGFDLWKNVGQHKAICCGLDNSKGEIVVVMDDDFQHPPEMITNLIIEIENSDFDVIIGSSKVKQSLFRKMGANMVQSLIRPGRKIAKGKRITGFVAIDKRLIRHMSVGRSSEPILSTMIFNATDRVGFIEVEAGSRISGRSGYSFSKLFNSTLDNYFSLNRTPLRRIALFGFSLASISFAYVLILFYRFIFENRPPAGYSSIMASILFFGGSTLLSLGFLGEYISRILVESKKAEIYSIKEEY